MTEPMDRLRNLITRQTRAALIPPVVILKPLVDPYYAELVARGILHPDNIGGPTDWLASPYTEPYVAPKEDS